ncbi:unnamed protein product [Darwinula stevensoni]|uniref:G domain-containing protein n=1 Tax=Darwinula stevensoni TaxID=69355 RepID=A0A7R9FPM6_9CRUS|nr:unnamed protein product [Darwinula stevensoni]CAG0898219.1 unnamed protein product [Darwinula stevensoni]
MGADEIEQLKEGKVPIKGTDPPTYLLSFRQIAKDRFQLGQQHGKCLIVLLLGLTGSGKSMLEEVMGNYLLGVDFRDSHRFRVKEDNGPTNQITSYTFYTRDRKMSRRPVTIIDTPGFQKGTPADDKKLIEDIRAFTQAIDIHAVVFVVPGSQIGAQSFVLDLQVLCKTSALLFRVSIERLFDTLSKSRILEDIGTATSGSILSCTKFLVVGNGFVHSGSWRFQLLDDLCRLTAEQKEVLTNMAKVLGDETPRIQEISYLFCTFADSKRLPVLESVKEAGLKYKKYYAVNSSSYFAKEEENDGSSSSDEEEEVKQNKPKMTSINELLWKMTNESIQEFMEDILDRKGKDKTPIGGKDLPTFLLPFQVIPNTTRRFRLGEDQEDKQQCLNILFIGPTGSGKSLLLEAMGNYVLGVEYGDPYRFQVKEGGPTNLITSHTFITRDKQRFPRPITFIDTPGFQKGTPKEDRKLMEDIRKYIHSNHRLGIHAIVQVLKDPQEKLTVEQNMLMKNMSLVFAGDTVRISYLFCIFADSKRFPDLDSTNEAELKSGEYFPANSSSYFAKKEGEEDGSDDDDENETGKKATSRPINKIMLKKTTESFERFNKAIQGNQPIQVRHTPIQEEKPEDDDSETNPLVTPKPDDATYRYRISRMSPKKRVLLAFGGIGLAVGIGLILGIFSESFLLAVICSVLVFVVYEALVIYVCTRGSTENTENRYGKGSGP